MQPSTSWTPFSCSVAHWSLEHHWRSISQQNSTWACFVEKHSLPCKCSPASSRSLEIWKLNELVILNCIAVGVNCMVCPPYGGCLTVYTGNLSRVHCTSHPLISYHDPQQENLIITNGVTDVSKQTLQLHNALFTVCLLCKVSLLSHSLNAAEPQ